jgi:predicted MPP superfamily phosphohydrolase
VTNLALLLGASQVGVAHWLSILVFGTAPFGGATALVLGVGLVLMNVLLAPLVRRGRRRGGARGFLARAYLGLAVATLLLGFVVAAAWLLFLPFAAVATLLDAPAAALLGAFRVGSGALVGSCAALLVWGFTGGQARVARPRLRVALPGLHPDLDGLRMAHLTDLHIGNGMEGRMLARMVDRANALEPDVMVLTGDLFDFDPAYIEEGAKGLAGLRARCGVYAVLGNHDHYTGADAVAAGLARFAPHIVLLRDEMVRLPVDEPLYLAGVEDPGHHWSDRDLDLPGMYTVAAKRPDDGPVVLLVHRPQAFPQAAKLGFPLVLAGHTHGGQLALPTPGGRYNLARFVTGFTRGLYRRNGSTLYVNRGLGVGGPAVRINCSREIATIELASKESAA